jgi:hypothetical protein
MATSSDKNQLLAQGRWFSPGTLASSTTKTGRHDIAEILLKVGLKHQKIKKKSGHNHHCIKMLQVITMMLLKNCSFSFI